MVGATAAALAVAACGPTANSSPTTGTGVTAEPPTASGTPEATSTTGGALGSPAATLPPTSGGGGVTDSGTGETAVVVASGSSVLFQNGRCSISRASAPQP